MSAWVLMCLLLLSANVAENHAGVAANLDTREKQLESLYAEYWRTEYKIAMGEHNLSSRPIQEQIRAVVSDDHFLRDLDRTNFSDRILKTRRKLFLNQAVYTRITNDPTLTAVVEQITQQENSTRYKVGALQLTRAELNDLLAHNPDRKLREEACGQQARSLLQTASAFKIRSSCATSSRENIRLSSFPLLCCTGKA
jgi:hypothetical protein